MPLVSVLIKPASGSCNLRCSYCFYTDEVSRRAAHGCGVMSDETMECLIRRIFESAETQVSIGFQGGEPLLAGLAYYERFTRLAAAYNRRGVPVLSILVSALITFLCVIVNYVLPHKALELLMSLVVAALVINWAMISLSHLKFRAAMKRQGVDTFFKALWSPFSNYLCLAFVVFILGIMLMIPGINISVYAIPFWLLLMWLCYRVKLSLAERRGLGQQA